MCDFHDDTFHLRRCGYEHAISLCNVQMAHQLSGEVEMTQKVTVTLEDDIDGGPAEETVRFGLAGSEYEIDLNTKNANGFRLQLAPFIERARRSERGRTARPVRNAASRQRSQAVRAWAKSQGLAVGDRGRIPASVVESYEAAAR